MRMSLRSFVVVLLCCTALLGLFASPAAAAKPQRKTLKYYVHESLGGPNATVIGIAGRNGNLSDTGFGYTFVATNVIKDGGLETSNVIGYAPAAGFTSSKPSVTKVQITHALNSTKLGVGDIEISGKLDLSMPIKPSELVVSGGTGDFKFWRGVVRIELVWVSYPFTLYRVVVKLVRY